MPLRTTLCHRVRKIFSWKQDPPSRHLTIQAVDGAAPSWWNLRQLEDVFPKHWRSGTMSQSHAKAFMSSAVSLSASPAISHNCQRGNSWGKNVITTEIINYFKQEKIPSQTWTTQQLNHVKAVWEVGLVRCSSDRLTGVTYLYSNMGTKTPFSVQFPQSK